MEKPARYLNVKTIDGRVLLSLYFDPASGIILEGKFDGPAPQEKDAPRGNGGNGSSRNDDEPMTYPQKRYLFRILAQQGIEGDKASQRLLNLFQADSLKDITKLEASRMIERLLKEAKGGEPGGIPF